MNTFDLIGIPIQLKIGEKMYKQQCRNKRQKSGKTNVVGEINWYFKKIMNFNLEFL